MAGCFVSDDVLPGCISALRKAFNDNARKPEVIGTIHKGGYRLLLPIERLNDHGPQHIAARQILTVGENAPLGNRGARIAVICIHFAAFTRLPSAGTTIPSLYLPFVNAGQRSSTAILE